MSSSWTQRYLKISNATNKTNIGSVSVLTIPSTRMKPTPMQISSSDQYEDEKQEIPEKKVRKKRTTSKKQQVQRSRKRKRRTSISDDEQEEKKEPKQALPVLKKRATTIVNINQPQQLQQTIIDKTPFPLSWFWQDKSQFTWCRMIQGAKKQCFFSQYIFWIQILSFLTAKEHARVSVTHKASYEASKHVMSFAYLSMTTFIKFKLEAKHFQKKAINWAMEQEIRGIQLENGRVVRGGLLSYPMGLGKTSVNFKSILLITYLQGGNTLEERARATPYDTIVSFVNSLGQEEIVDLDEKWKLAFPNKQTDAKEEKKEEHQEDIGHDRELNQVISQTGRSALRHHRQLQHKKDANDMDTRDDLDYRTSDEDESEEEEEEEEESEEENEDSEDSETDMHDTDYVYTRSTKPRSADNKNANTTTTQTTSLPIRMTRSRSLDKPELKEETGQDTTPALTKPKAFFLAKVKTTLWICPCSTRKQVRDDILKHTDLPADRILIYEGTVEERRCMAATGALGRFAFIIVSYNTVLSDFKRLGRKGLFGPQWNRIVWDEAQIMKKGKNQIPQAMLALKGERRWLLSGTPISGSSFMEFHFFCQLLGCGPPWDQEETWKKYSKLLDAKSKIPPGTIVKRKRGRKSHEELNLMEVQRLCMEWKRLMEMSCRKQDLYRAKQVLQNHDFDLPEPPKVKTIVVPLLKHEQEQMKQWENSFRLAFGPNAEKENKQDTDGKYGGKRKITMTTTTTSTTSTTFTRSRATAMTATTSTATLTTSLRSTRYQTRKQRQRQDQQEQTDQIDQTKELSGKDEKQMSLQKQHQGMDLMTFILRLRQLSDHPLATSGRHTTTVFAHQACGTLHKLPDLKQTCASCQAYPLGESKYCAAGKAFALSSGSQDNCHHVYCESCYHRNNGSRCRLCFMARESSAKNKQAIEIILSQRKLGKKCLVFAEYLSELDMLEYDFHRAGISYIRIDGETPMCKRDELLERFRDSRGGIDVLAMSNTGGLGLNLQAASVVILMDQDWLKTVEDQKIGRADRCGQTEQVLVFRIVADVDIEKGVAAVQNLHLNIQQFMTASDSVVSEETLIKSVVQKRESMKPLIAAFYKGRSAPCEPLIQGAGGAL